MNDTAKRDLLGTVKYRPCLVLHAGRAANGEADVPSQEASGGQVVALLCGLSHKIRIPAIRIRECRFINKILRIRIPESLFSYCENKDTGNSDFMGQTAVHEYAGREII